MSRLRRLIVAIAPVTALSLTACSRSNSEAAPDAGKAAAPVLTPLAEADDVARAMLASYPSACQAAASDSRWSKCHDEVPGFELVLKCAEQAAAFAHATAKAFTPAAAQSGCGKWVATGTREVVEAMPVFLDATVSWLKANREKLVPAMARKTLSEACADVDCSGKPMSGEGAHAKATFQTVNSIECTKLVFQCGRDAKNVCFIGKAASRLNVACDASENHVADPLLVSSTRERLTVTARTSTPPIDPFDGTTKALPPISTVVKDRPKAPSRDRAYAELVQAELRERSKSHDFSQGCIATIQPTQKQMTRIEDTIQKIPPGEDDRASIELADAASSLKLCAQCTKDWVPHCASARRQLLDARAILSGEPLPE